jgi:predicted NAD/FAD-binding protein
MKIAIIGAGISGLVAAYKLSRQHEITLFEANDYIGGHTSTVDVETETGSLAVDTGFIVFNDRTYPNFNKLLDELNVPSQPTTMSFSVRCDRTGLEYRGADLNGLFAQRRNLLNPKFLRLLYDLVKFEKHASWLLESQDETMTVKQFFAKTRVSQAFIEHYFIPMGSAVWSCPADKLLAFPMSFILQFYRNHGLLGLRDRPQWKVIRGGSREYVKKLVASFRDRIRLQTPVQQVRRSPDEVEICLTDSSENFDHVIFACHSDQALRLLQCPSNTERELLGAFAYERNQVVLHTDTSLLPRSRRAWACWNYHRPQHNATQATVTYNMNMLQTLRSRETYCVTLNETQWIDPSKVLRQFNFSHPVFTSQRASAQARHRDLIDSDRTSYCGAYWGNGFHEDGVNSALAVCERLGREAERYEKLYL